MAVRTAWLNTQTLQEQYLLAEKSLQQAKEALRLVEKHYGAGTAGYE